MTDAERRTSPRVDAPMWIRIAGLDGAPRRRVGNISEGGIYFEVGRDPGEPGSVISIHATTLDRVCSFEALAQVVRVVGADDLRRGRIVAGVALAFVPESAGKMAAIGRFVHHVAEVERARGDRWRQAADLIGGRPQPRISTLGAGKLVLVSEWPADPGDAVEGRIHTRGRGGPVAFYGTVTRTRPIEDRPARGGYRVEVKVDLTSAAEDEGEGSSIGRSLKALLSDALEANGEYGGAAARGMRLAGQLARVRLTSLLLHFEAAGLSGEIALGRDGERARVVITAGTVTTIEARRRPGEDDVALLERLCAWERGTFEVVQQPLSEPGLEDDLEVGGLTLSGGVRADAALAGAHRDQSGPRADPPRRPLRATRPQHPAAD